MQFRALTLPLASGAGTHQAFGVLHEAGKTADPHLAHAPVGEHLSAEVHARLEAARSPADRDEVIHGIAHALVERGCRVEVCA